MYSLIVTVISIALFSVAISAGINYIDSDRVIAKNKAMTLQRNIVSIGLGMTTFKNLTKKEASSPEQIVPSFSSLSFGNDNITLSGIGASSYVGQSNVRYSCFFINNANDSDRLMYQKINNEYQSEQVILVTNCNDSSDTLAINETINSFRIKFYYL
tara:strand:- start:1517 stop:1987 length:471 start_codon:yes stop_codon:yes gene_type:complete